MVPRDQIQPHTISFTMDGVDWDKVVSYITSDPDELRLGPLAGYGGLTKDQLLERIKKVTDITELGDLRGFHRELAQGLATGEWHGMSGIGFFLMPRDGGVIQAHFQHSSHVSGAIRPMSRTIHTRDRGPRQVVMALKFIKKYLPGFENAYLTRICTEARVRESRRIMGDYRLTSEDVVEARKFPDVMGKSGFPTGHHHVVGVDTIVFDQRDVASHGSAEGRGLARHPLSVPRPAEGGGSAGRREAVFHR